MKIHICIFLTIDPVNKTQKQNWIKERFSEIQIVSLCNIFQ